MPLNAKLKDRLKLAGKSGKLILNFLKIDRVPDEFAGLTSITELRLRGNRVKELPSWIANCRGLREIDLASNPISKLPDFLGDLPDLQELRLEDTRVRSLPASFAKLKKIQRLWLSPGVAVPSGPRLKAAVQSAREFQEAIDRAKAAEAAPSPAPEPRTIPPRPKQPSLKPVGEVSSWGDPLLVVDAASAREWRGAGPDGKSPEYRRACRAIAKASVTPFSSGAVRGFLWDVQGEGTVYVFRTPEGLMLVRPWMEDGDDEEETAGILAAVPSAKTISAGSQSFLSGGVAFLGSAYDARELPMKVSRKGVNSHGEDSEALLVAAPRGTCRLRCDRVKRPEGQAVRMFLTWGSK
jgi:hypothetical protein